MSTKPARGSPLALPGVAQILTPNKIKCLWKKDRELKHHYLGTISNYYKSMWIHNCYVINNCVIHTPEVYQM